MVKAPPETSPYVKAILTEKEAETVRTIRAQQQMFPNVKIFYFGGSEENVRLVESCVKTIAYLQEKYPQEPIKAWIESVPPDTHTREIVKRKLTDAIRQYFTSPEEIMESGMFN